MNASLYLAPTLEPVSLEDLKLHLRIELDVLDEDEYLEGLIKTAREHVEDITRRQIITATWDYYLDGWPKGDAFKLPFGNLQSVSAVTYKESDWTTEELMTLDVAPATAWVAGNTLTGIISTKTCVIVEVLTTKSYRVKDRSGTFTLGEIITNGTVTADQGISYPTFVSGTGLVEITDYIVETNGEGCGRIVLPYSESWPTDTLYTSNPILIRFICGWTTAALVLYKIKAAIKMICSKLYESRGEDVLGQTVSEDKVVNRLLASARLWDEFL